jgi:hypothetical protein
MMSKVLIADIHRRLNGRVTLIDAGSAFDPLLFGQTRLGQATQAQAKAFFDQLNQE